MTDQELPEGFFSRLEVSKESGMGCFEILPPDAEAMPRDKEEWRKAMEIQSETRRSRPMENKSDAETRQIADLRSRISDYLRGGGLFNPELAQHHAVRDLMLDIDRVLSARLTAPSVEEVIECERCHGNGRVELLEHCPECLGTGSGDIKEKINLLMRRKYPMAGTVWLIRCESYGWGPDAKPIETGWRVKTSWPGPNYIGESIYRDEFAESLPELAAKLRSE